MDCDLQDAKMSTYSHKKERKMIQWSEGTIENTYQQQKSRMPSGKGTMIVVFSDEDSLAQFVKEIFFSLVVFKI